MTPDPSPRTFSGSDGMATGCSNAILAIARILIGWLFLSAGWNKLMDIPRTTKYLANLGVPAADLAAWPTALGEFAIGVALILGLATRYAALLAAAFVVVATALAHRYWSFPAAQQAGQYVHFIKNLAIFGGTLLLFVTGAGRFSLDGGLGHKRR